MTADDTTPTVTRAMLEAAQQAEIEHYKRSLGATFAATPLPVLKLMLEASLAVMGPAQPLTNWGARWDSLGPLDGEALDSASRHLDDLWQAEYKVAFIAYALARPGWSIEAACSWADDMAGEALVACCGTDVTPNEVAWVDVVECEREWRNV